MKNSCVWCLWRPESVRPVTGRVPGTISCSVQVLGTVLKPSGKAVHRLNCWAILPAPKQTLFLLLFCFVFFFETGSHVAQTGLTHHGAVHDLKRRSSLPLSSMLGRQAYITIPGLCSRRREDRTQGSVYPRQVLYQLSCIPSLSHELLWTPLERGMVGADLAFSLLPSVWQSPGSSDKVFLRGGLCTRKDGGMV